MHKRRRLQKSYLPDLFTPVPQRPTWDNLPLAVTQRVTELLAEIIRGHRTLRILPGLRKGAADE
jgi:hypothetical protein